MFVALEPGTRHILHVLCPCSRINENCMHAYPEVYNKKRQPAVSSSHMVNFSDYLLHRNTPRHSRERDCLATIFPEKMVQAGS